MCLFHYQSVLQLSTDRKSINNGLGKPSLSISFHLFAYNPSVLWPELKYLQLQYQFIYSFNLALSRGIVVTLRFHPYFKQAHCFRVTIETSVLTQNMKRHRRKSYIGSLSCETSEEGLERHVWRGLCLISFDPNPWIRDSLFLIWWYGNKKRYITYFGA